jgi:Flp pilus assembly protein TadD/class 3 adenylate cyclase
MPEYLAVVFSDLVRHSDEWGRLPRERMVALVAEYRYIAESLAGQYGCRYREWAGDGHMFLFESADAAAQFALKLIDSWRIGSESLPTLRELPRLPLRLGCHFGECTPMDGEGWIGRGNAIAKRVEGEADPDTLLVTESVLDLLDLPLYEVEPTGERELKGDHLSSRRLYRVAAFREELFLAKPGRDLTAEEWFLKGAALIGTEREWSDEEEGCYREALRLRPDYPEALNNLAVVLRARGQGAEAAQRYQEALELRPDYPEAHYNYAALLASRGSLAGAASHFSEALRLRPDYVDAHEGYATLLKLRGDAAEAEAHHCEALRLRPDYPEAHSNLAVLLDESGRPDEAAHHYREALRLRPEYAEGHYNYALFLDDQGEGTAAEAHYREALRLRPDYPEAMNNLAALLHVSGRLEEAEELYLAALGARPDDPEAHFNYGLLLEARGEDAAAMRHFRAAHELAPEVERFRTAVER